MKHKPVDKNFFGLLEAHIFFLELGKGITFSARICVITHQFKKLLEKISIFLRQEPSFNLRLN